MLVVEFRFHSSRPRKLKNCARHSLAQRTLDFSFTRLSMRANTHSRIRTLKRIHTNMDRLKMIEQMSTFIRTVIAHTQHSYIYTCVSASVSVVSVRIHMRV